MLCLAQNIDKVKPSEKMSEYIVNLFKTIVVEDSRELGYSVAGDYY
jgi:hypothetical protein